MTGRLAQICRHPIKGHGRETLASVRLLAGACLPWDRHWAVAHEAARLEPGWNPCVNFARGAKAPGLMAISSTLDEATATVTLHHPDREDLRFRPDDPADLAVFLDWVRPLNPENRAQPKAIVAAGRGMTDSEFQSVSILTPRLWPICRRGWGKTCRHTAGAATCGLRVPPLGQNSIGSAEPSASAAQVCASMNALPVATQPR